MIEGMKHSIRLSAALLPLAALAFSGDVRAAAADLWHWIHAGFVVVFVEAATFLQNCF
jgi:hypothetical protein